MPTQSIPIELGGKTRHIRFTFNALVALEEELGIPISEIGNILSGSVSLTNLRRLVWAGLIHEDEELTQKQVGDMLSPDIIFMIAEKLAKAFEAAFPSEEENPKKAGSSQGNKEQKE
jgi:hypothetical protein